LQAHRVLISLLLAAIAGVVTVLIFYYVGFRFTILSTRFYVPGTHFDTSLMWAVLKTYDVGWDRTSLYWAVPAFLVHLWLPFFAIGILGLRILQTLRYGIGKAQWFLSGGTNHPIEAAGVIAAILVFIGTGSYHLAHWLVG
jgi:hypothetical protein